MLLFLYSFAFFSQALAQEIYIYKVSKNESLTNIQNQFAPQLNGHSLRIINKHINNFYNDQQSEVIVHSLVSVSYCRHTVKKGNTMGSLIRKFSYSKPWELDLPNYSQQINPHITDINKLEPVDQIKVPVVFLKTTLKYIPENLSCQQLLKIHNSNPFLLANNQLKAIKSQETQFKVPPKDLVSRKYSIGLGLIYDSLHEKEFSEKIVSDAQPSLSFAIKNNITHKYFFEFNYQLIYKRYKQSATTTNLNETNLIQNSFNVGAGYNFNYLTDLNLQLGARETVVYKQTSTNTYNLLKSFTPLIELQFTKHLFNMLNSDTYLITHLRYQTKNDDIDFSGGFDYGLGLGLVSDYYIKGLSASVLYHFGNFKTSDYNYEHRWLDINLTYNF